MPHCQNCHSQIPAEQLTIIGNYLFCETCVEKSNPPLVDYELSYSKREGFKASARLGMSNVSIHIPQEELLRVFK